MTVINNASQGYIANVMLGDYREDFVRSVGGCCLRPARRSDRCWRCRVYLWLRSSGGGWDDPLDFDADGRLVGIEVLDASTKLPPELLAQADVRD